jgi:hypothetical protein
VRELAGLSFVEARQQCDDRHKIHSYPRNCQPSRYYRTCVRSWGGGG